jgi:hypothetical protein
MDDTFEKESLWIEWVPIAILWTLSFVCVVAAIVSDTVLMTCGGLLMAIILATPPILGLGYLKSFQRVIVSGNTIMVVQKNDAPEFIIPHHLGRVKIDADDLQLELKKEGRRFVLRSHFLKNKAAFHQLFDQMIKDHPPSEDRVVLKASVLEMMNRLKDR